MLLKSDEMYEARSLKNNQQQSFNLRQHKKTKN